MNLPREVDYSRNVFRWLLSREAGAKDIVKECFRKMGHIERLCQDFDGSGIMWLWYCSKGQFTTF